MCAQNIQSVPLNSPHGRSSSSSNSSVLTRLRACEEVYRWRVFFCECVWRWKEGEMCPKSPAIVIQTQQMLFTSQEHIVSVCRDQSDADRISNTARESLIQLGFISCPQLWWNKDNWDETRVVLRSVWQWYPCFVWFCECGPPALVSSHHRLCCAVTESAFCFAAEL